MDLAFNKKQKSSKITMYMKQLSTTLWLSLSLCTVLSSCNELENNDIGIEQSTSEAFDLNATREIIQEKTRQFTEAHISRDTGYLNNIFTSDARVFPPQSEIVTGRKAIAKLNYDWVNYGIHEFSEVSANMYGNDEYLIDEGTYYLVYGDEKSIDNGKYINIWKNQEGDWKLYSNIWNTSMGQKPEEPEQ